MRLFQQYCIRNEKSLNGIWKFRMEGFDKEYRMPVPGAFEQHPDFLKHRGVGTYEKQVFLKDDTHVRLFFQGISHTCDIFWDGEKVAHHYNAFTPFAVVIPEQKSGAHELRIVVDNRFSEDSSLHVPNDYYSYGGITRSASIEQLSDVYIKQVHMTPLRENDGWLADIRVEIENVSSKDQELRFHASLREDEDYDFDAGAFYFENLKFHVGEKKTLHIKQAFPDVKAWSDNEPNLYLLQCALAKDGEWIDDRIERVGFRTLEISGKNILLNGEKIFIKGFNRHEDYAQIGCAIPLQLMVKDLDLMEDMGGNSVRCSHYPNDDMFLDLCDERGILVWEEGHARGFGLDRMQNPNFDRQSEDCIREMIAAHYNHPSIYIWAVLNECASETEEGREIYAKQLGLLKELDTSRPTSFATCRHLSDICLDLPDVVSFNMYSGWYIDNPVAETNEEELEWIKASGGEGKPVMVTEVGAGAIYGFRDRTRQKWSEEGQCDIIRENLEVYMNHPDIMGVYLWQFADCRVTEEEWFARRPRSYNNKGIVDEYRRPKLSYDVVKELFEKKSGRIEE